MFLRLVRSENVPRMKTQRDEVARRTLTLMAEAEEESGEVSEESMQKNRRGFGALLNIVSEQANAELLVLKLGRMAFLVEQMKEYQADKDVMVHACVMLRNLSRFQYLSDRIVDAKAVSALASAIESHRNTPDIQKPARSAMRRLM